MQHLSSSKFPTTLDIKFDNQNQESVLKDDALNRYQENCYLMGKIFSITDPQAKKQDDEESSDDSDSSSSSENEQMGDEQ